MSTLLIGSAVAVARAEQPPPIQTPREIQKPKGTWPIASALVPTTISVGNITCASWPGSMNFRGAEIMAAKGPGCR